MKRYISLKESSNSLIICDVQPHDMGKFIKWDEYKFADFVNSYNKILVLYNGDDFGWESEMDMMMAYEDWGIDIDKCIFYDKGYAWFRGLMDTGYDLEEVVKYMLDNNINDSREIDEEILLELLDTDEVPMDSINIPDVADEIKKWNRSDLCGGARNECLAEIKILMDALNMKYKEINKWIYG